MSICLKRCSNASTRTRAHARRETVEHTFGTIKARTGATHFLTTLPKVAAEMALSVLAYNLTRAMNIVGIKPMMLPSRPDTSLRARAGNVVQYANS